SCRAESPRRGGAGVPLEPSVDELDLDSLVDHLAQRLGVPIRETHAAVRLGLADVRRLRRALGAVAGAQVGPGVSPRVVGARSDGEGLLRLDALAVEVGAVGVSGIFIDRANGPRPARSGPLLAADRRRIKADQLSTAVQRANGAWTRTAACWPISTTTMPTHGRTPGGECH